jgi:hypothetical protein
MKNPTFPALCFLILAYCIGFVTLALVMVVVRSIPNTIPTTGISAETLAPIFEPVGSIDAQSFWISNPESPQTIANSPLTRTTTKKPKVTLASLIREEATLRAS